MIHLFMPAQHRISSRLPKALLIGLLLAALTACLPPALDKKQAPSTAQRLVILHTNDIHGSIGQDTLETQNPAGGFTPLSQWVEHYRQDSPELLLLDAGDLMTGGPASTLRHGGIEGGGMMALMNAMHYDAWTLGNHEFDRGQDHLAQLLGLVQIPTLTSNLSHHNGEELFGLTQDHLILQRNGLSIGLIGLETNDLSTLLPVSELGGLALTPVAQAAQYWVRQLDEKTDVIILLTHQGLEADRQLARQVPGIDIIIGGHSHTALSTPIVEGGTVIVQAGAELQYLGHLEVIIQDDAVQSHTGRLIPLNQRPENAAAPEVEALVVDLNQRINTRFGKVVATVKTPLLRAHSTESALGNWITDQIRARAESDIAVLNSGGMRQDLHAGPLTLGDLHGLMPFEDKLTTFEVSGTTLIEMLKHNAKLATAQSYGILQVSGLSYAWRSDENGVDVFDIRVGGAPLLPGQTYTVATSDYIARSQPHKYLGWIPKSITPTPLNILDILLEAAQEQGSIEAQLENRIVEAQP